MTTNVYIMLVAAASFCLVSSMAIDDKTVDVRSESELLINTLQEYFNEHNLETVGDDQDQSNRCSCGGNLCTCCIKVRIFKKKVQVCIQVGFIPQQTVLIIRVTVNGRIIINKRISARNPPALCAGIPFLRRLASLCLKFSNISIINRRFHACISVQVKLAGKTIVTIKLGCFTIPPTQNSSVIGEDISSVIGEDIGSVAGENISSVIGEDISSVIGEDISSVIGEDISSVIEAQISSVIEAQIKSVIELRSNQ